MALIAYVNGRFVPLNNAMVHIEDRGFQFADGVYEVATCTQGRFFLLQEHLDRLERSCRAIQLRLPVTLSELEGLVHEIYRRNQLQDAMIYIQVTRGVAPRSHGFPEYSDPSLIITQRLLPRPDEQKCRHGVNGITLADFRWKHCEIKSISLLASIMGKQQAMENGAEEAFWLDHEGHVLEGCSTNIFAVIGGTLVTHPLDHQILAGITRDLAIKLATKDGMRVEERPWRLMESDISECLMSSSTNAILPVVQMDGKPIGAGAPGPVANQLRGLILKQMNQRGT